MKIDEVKTCRKFGEFKLKEDNSPNLITIEWCKDIDEETLRDESPKVYLIVSDGEIKKIGGSAAKGGIKNTINFYINARTGSPGRPRFIIHGLIARELKNNKKVELYVITSPKVKSKICGLFDCNEEKEIASFKEMEDRCKSDYFEKERKYPDWNFQENNQPYPQDLEEEFLKYHEERLNNRNK